MNIESLTIAEARQIAALFNSTQISAAPINKSLAKNMGENIVVLDRGFVYVGNVVIDGDFVQITEAKNIRYWGTKNGLGELRDGPLKETKLDDIGEVIAPLRAVIHFVPVKGFK